MSKRPEGYRPRVYTPVVGVSRTKQSFKPICDINTIVEKALKGEAVTHLAGSPPLYADVTSVPDYQAALNIVIAAGNRFEKLDAKVRERFNNDPAKLVEFVGREENRDEAIRLGLLPKPEAVKAVVKDPPETEPKAKPRDPVAKPPAGEAKPKA